MKMENAVLAIPTPSPFPVYRGSPFDPGRAWALSLPRPVVLVSIPRVIRSTPRCYLKNRGRSKMDCPAFGKNATQIG